MDKNAIFKEHVVETDVLIVDKNPNSRTRLMKIMFDLGCSRNKIHTAGSLVEAEQIISEKSIGIVLADYFIQGGSGFDLFKMVRAKGPETKKLVMILVTSNISQSAVAKAAEEDVDSFIIKPYTLQSIQENLVATVANKIKPPPYVVKVDEGKELIAQEKYAEAIEVLREATKLHPKPALALFYIGQAESMQALMDKAKGSYSSGLKYNNIHYKCLIGLYSMFMEKEEWSQAYQIVKKIAKFFPANPDRLAEIVRLAVRTKNFEDMELYYEIFTSLDERVEQIEKYIGAGLYVSGKHFLMEKNYELGLKFFEYFTVTCARRTKILRAIISCLVEGLNVELAEKYLSRFEPSAKEGEDYLVAEFMVMSGQNKPAAELVKHGLGLYNKKIRDPRCLEVMIACMKSCNYKQEMIKAFEQELSSLDQPQAA